MDSIFERATPGTRIVAVLPDVLRSGARYGRWRGEMARRAEIEDVTLLGTFDKHADVDVFLFTATISGPGSWPGFVADKVIRVGDLFTVCTGPVVDYRDPREGPKSVFLTSRRLVPWETMAAWDEWRNFGGRLIKPPFVAVKRTSRRGDKHRALGTIINAQSDVAVENHVIVLRPKDGTIATCELLLESLMLPATTEWLDERICCRHLTNAALRELPLWQQRR